MEQISSTDRRKYMSAANEEDYSDYKLNEK